MLAPVLLFPIWRWAWERFGAQPDASSQLPFFAGACGLILILASIAGSYTDIRWHKIPNWITYSAALWGLLLNIALAVVGQPSAAWIGGVGIADSLFGGAVLFLVMLIVLSITGGGAGDVKLVGAIGLLIGLERGIDAALYSFAIAGAVVLMWSVLRHGPVKVFGSFVRWVGHFFLPVSVAKPSEDQKKLLRTPIPLGPFFAAGACLACSQGEIYEIWQNLFSG